MVVMRHGARGGVGAVFRRRLCLGGRAGIIPRDGHVKVALRRPTADLDTAHPPRTDVLVGCVPATLGLLLGGAAIALGDQIAGGCEHGVGAVLVESDRRTGRGPQVARGVVTHDRSG